ncbi:hypothetical protein CMV_017462 [Castanea mollissima]|uniref:Uncharacterized protein n=1 Tax=Castanea mollissima TaxID=60419 RepID=A0A8J4QSP3_9ROSI|nr:hypothetical protein CMV_017462 [Castanea mollissima]
MKKAEKKRRKKAEKSIPEDAMDDDYDFNVDYVKKRSAMDVGDEDDENLHCNQNGEKSGILVSFLHSNFLSIGELVVPHYRNVFSGVFGSFFVKFTHGVLTGKRCVFFPYLVFFLLLYRFVVTEIQELFCMTGISVCVRHLWFMCPGKIPYYTMPPIRNQGEPSEAKIVSELGKKFNIDEVYDTESSFIGSLRSVDDLNLVGKIPYYTMPPIRNQGEPSEAKIVSELGKKFNIDEVYDTESSFIGSLRSVDDLNPVKVPPSCPLNFDEDLLENDEPKHSIQSGEGPKDMDNDGDDVSMACEEDEEGRNKGKTATSRQNEKLYAVEGMLNTKMKKEEKEKS